MVSQLGGMKYGYTDSRPNDITPNDNTPNDIRGAVKFKPENARISTRGTVSKILHNIIIKH